MAGKNKSSILSTSKSNSVFMEKTVRSLIAHTITVTLTVNINWLTGSSISQRLELSVSQLTFTSQSSAMLVLSISRHLSPRWQLNSSAISFSFKNTNWSNTSNTQVNLLIHSPHLINISSSNSKSLPRFRNMFRIRSNLRWRSNYHLNWISTRITLKTTTSNKSRLLRPCKTAWVQPLLNK